MNPVDDTSSLWFSRLREQRTGPVSAKTGIHARMNPVDNTPAPWFVRGSKTVLVVYGALMTATLLIAQPQRLAFNGLVLFTPPAVLSLIVVRLIARGRGGIAAEACFVLMIVAWMMAYMYC